MICTKIVEFKCYRVQAMSAAEEEIKEEDCDCVILLDPLKKPRKAFWNHLIKCVYPSLLLALFYKYLKYLQKIGYLIQPLPIWQSFKSLHLM